MRLKRKCSISFRSNDIFVVNYTESRRSRKRVGTNLEGEGFGFGIRVSKSSFDLCCWRMGYRESNLETIHPHKHIVVPGPSVLIAFPHEALGMSMVDWDWFVRNRDCFRRIRLERKKKLWILKYLPKNICGWETNNKTEQELGCFLCVLKCSASVMKQSKILEEIKTKSGLRKTRHFILSPNKTEIIHCEILGEILQSRTTIPRVKKKRSRHVDMVSWFTSRAEKNEKTISSHRNYNPLLGTWLR